MDSEVLEQIVLASFLGELEAFKPGNVSVYADGHDMTVHDFQKSAELVTPILCDKSSNLGQRVFKSVDATKTVVGCNTNLGMLLLFAPLVMAAESEFANEEDLRFNLENTLSSVTQADADQVFAAICLANPGGLGEADKYDVHEQPDCSLLQAMLVASERDSIALQYTNNFHEIFNIGYVTMKDFDKYWNSVKWSTVSCYLNYLSLIHDSHIERKFGRQVAEQIKIKSRNVVRQFNDVKDPETGVALLQNFDRELKQKGYNPGTSADLTAASLLVYNLVNQDL